MMPLVFVYFEKLHKQVKMEMKYDPSSSQKTVHCSYHIDLASPCSKCCLWLKNGSTWSYCNYYISFTRLNGNITVSVFGFKLDIVQKKNYCYTSYQIKIEDTYSNNKLSNYFICFYISSATFLENAIKC